MWTQKIFFFFFCPDNESAPILFSYKRSLKNIFCVQQKKEDWDIFASFFLFLSTITVFFQLLTHMNTKEDIVKNVGNQSVAGSHRYPYNGKTCYGVHGKPKTVCSLQNVTFCVQQKKETHTILEKLEGEQMMAEFKCSYWLDPFVCLFKCGINRRVN